MASESCPQVVVGGQAGAQTLAGHPGKEQSTSQGNLSMHLLQAIGPAPCFYKEGSRNATALMLMEIHHQKKERQGREL